MPALLLAAAATAFTAPTFSLANARKLMQNYPTEAVRNGWSAAALIDLEVDPNGRIKHCSTIAAFGRKELADQICVLARLVKAEPASINGAPSFSVYRTFIRFALPGNKLGREIQAMRQPSDLTVTVDRLPAGDTNPMGINMLIDTAGSIQGCIGGKNAQLDYAKVACEQASGMTFSVLSDDEGRPVSYVRNVTVEFRLSDATVQSSPATGD